jgi:hypothetical protein
MHRWTEADIEKLKELAGKRRASQIARDLHRSQGSVLKKAAALGLSLELSNRSQQLKKSPKGVKPATGDD